MRNTDFLIDTGVYYKNILLPSILNKDKNMEYIKKLKEKFDLLFFKRKFANFIETKQIELEEDIKRSKDSIIKYLLEDKLEYAYNEYRNVELFEKRINKVTNFNEYVLKLIKDNKLISNKKDNDD